MTLVLTRADVRRLAAPHDYFDAVGDSFRAVARGQVHSPAPMEIEGTDGAFHAKGASMIIGGRRLAALKVNGNFPLNPKHGLPTIQGAILFSDAENGALIAILDSIEITLRRTAAASALATDLLARRSAETLLICGAGVQGRAHAEAIAPLRPFRRAFVYDLDFAKATLLAEEMTRSHGFVFTAIARFGELAPESDVIVTTTPARAPFLFPHHARKGAFIAAVGADNPMKNEIAPELMRNAAVVTDVTAQCAQIGDLRAAIAAGAMTVSDIRAQLGDIANGTSGRRNEDEAMVFDSTGAAFQDLAACAMIVDRARKEGAGGSIVLQ